MQAEDIRLTQIAQALEQIAKEVEVLGGYSWSAYDLRYMAGRLKSDIGDPNAFDDFNRRYAKPIAELEG